MQIDKPQLRSTKHFGGEAWQFLAFKFTEKPVIFGWMVGLL